MRRGGLVTEARVLQRLSSHPNLVQFYRWSTDDRGNEYIIVELVPFGSLDKVLISFGVGLRNRSKVLMCEQICDAMCQLAEEGVLHRDLAARNILVQSMDPVHVKVTDFGLARVDPSGGTNASPRPSSAAAAAPPPPALVPVRWSPPEVLQSAAWSEKSDVWSFGITMWEIFSNGAEPYAAKSETQAAAAINTGELLPRPKQCPKPMWGLMNDCWRRDPRERPSFSQIAALFRRWREQMSRAKATTVLSCDQHGNVQHPAMGAASEPGPSPLTGLAPIPLPAQQLPRRQLEGIPSGEQLMAADAYDALPLNGASTLVSARLCKPLPLRVAQPAVLTYAMGQSQQAAVLPPLPPIHDASGEQQQQECQQQQKSRPLPFGAAAIAGIMTTSPASDMVRSASLDGSILGDAAAAAAAASQAAADAPLGAAAAYHSPTGSGNHCCSGCSSFATPPDSNKGLKVPAMAGAADGGAPLVSTAVALLAAQQQQQGPVADAGSATGGPVGLPLLTVLPISVTVQPASTLRSGSRPGSSPTCANGLADRPVAREFDDAQRVPMLQPTPNLSACRHEDSTCASGAGLRFSGGGAGGPYHMPSGISYDDLCQANPSYAYLADGDAMALATSSSSKFDTLLTAAMMHAPDTDTPPRGMRSMFHGGSTVTDTVVLSMEVETAIDPLISYSLMSTQLLGRGGPGMGPGPGLPGHHGGSAVGDAALAAATGSTAALAAAFSNIISGNMHSAAGHQAVAGAPGSTGGLSMCIGLSSGDVPGSHGGLLPLQQQQQQQVFSAPHGSLPPGLRERLLADRLGLSCGSAGVRAAVRAAALRRCDTAERLIGVPEETAGTSSSTPLLGPNDCSLPSAPQCGVVAQQHSPYAVVSVLDEQPLPSQQEPQPAALPPQPPPQQQQQHSQHLRDEISAPLELAPLTAPPAPLQPTASVGPEPLQVPQGAVAQQQHRHGATGSGASSLPLGLLQHRRELQPWTLPTAASENNATVATSPALPHRRSAAGWTLEAMCSTALPPSLQHLRAQHHAAAAVVRPSNPYTDISSLI